MRRNPFVFAAIAAFVGGCGGASNDTTTSPPPAVDHDAEGSWGFDNHGQVIPGNSFLFAVRESSGLISGTGSFAGEAGPYGGLVVSGTVAQDSLHLSIVYVPEPTVFPSLRPDTARFAGVLTNRDHIDGELTRGGNTSPVSFVRLVVGDRP